MFYTVIKLIVWSITKKLHDDSAADGINESSNELLNGKKHEKIDSRILSKNDEREAKANS